MGSIMPEYRAYIVGSDGHFKEAVHLNCADDETAKLYAKQLVDGHDVELWQYARKVATFEARDALTKQRFNEPTRDIQEQLDKSE
jgi:hypothetical protein